MTTENVKDTRIQIGALEAKEKFTKWIAERGGVMVWQNIDLSNCDAGDIYTPAFTEDGKEYDKPHWRVSRKEVVSDLSRFRFVKELKEVKRFRVAVRMGDQGFSMKLTDGSTRRVRAACAKTKQQTGIEPYYRFDYETQECVIETPIFED
jgi:hypothetical protein